MLIDYPMPGPIRAWETTKALAEANAEIKRLRDAISWRPIATAPKNNERALLVTNNILCRVAYWRTPDKGEEPWYSREAGLHRWRHEGGGYITATHWMPLPDRPATQNALAGKETK